MNLPQDFSEYLIKGVVKKASANKPRAEFLIQESEKSLRGLNKRIELMGFDEDNANSIIKDCYDIIMELIRAKMLMNGYNSAGQNAHESEVAYSKIMGLNDNEVSVLNDLRYFRNSITYYGKILDSAYAKQVFDFMKKIHPKLK
jgi:hypothetical protein